jgi:hypothetical protein
VLSREKAIVRCDRPYRDDPPKEIRLTHLTNETDNTQPDFAVLLWQRIMGSDHAKCLLYLDILACGEGEKGLR